MTRHFRPFPATRRAGRGQADFSAQYNIWYAEKSHKIRTVCPPARSHTGKSSLARAGTCETFARSEIAPPSRLHHEQDLRGRAGWRRVRPFRPGFRASRAALFRAGDQARVAGGGQHRRARHGRRAAQPLLRRPGIPPLLRHAAGSATARTRVPQRGLGRHRRCGERLHRHQRARRAERLARSPSRWSTTSSSRPRWSARTTAPTSPC